MPVINHPDQDNSVRNNPLISLLIAARNEEATILDCLRAIEQLSHPSVAIDVLIGNDQSTDQTSQRVALFIQERPAFRLIDITETIGGLSGKPNVLAQLARQARGQFLFFTDADTQVPTDWLTEMSRHFSEKVGIVTGVTLPEGSKIFHKLQTIDWLYNLTLTHLVSSMGIPLTAMGNNMAVSRVAYEAVGGYGSLPFSVVEDYSLFRAVVQKGYGFRNLLAESVLAKTKPVDTLREFLHQRKRWMQGATKLPAGIVALLYLQYLAGPLLLLAGWFNPELAIGVYLIRLLIQTTALSFGMTRLHRTGLWPFALLFEPYQLLMGPLAVLFYWFPAPMEWKGRKYK